VLAVLVTFKPIWRIAWLHQLEEDESHVKNSIGKSKNLPNMAVKKLALKAKLLPSQVFVIIERN
jgi:hypothetical protein